MKSLKLLALCCLLTLSSCGSIPDVPSCVELNPEQGFCKYAISGKEFFIDSDHLFDGKSWSDIKQTSIIVPPSSWGAIKKYLKKQCAKHGCDSPEATPVENSIKRLDQLRK